MGFVSAPPSVRALPKNTACLHRSHRGGKLMGAADVLVSIDNSPCQGEGLFHPAKPGELAAPAPTKKAEMQSEPIKPARRCKNANHVASKLDRHSNTVHSHRPYRRLKVHRKGKKTRVVRQRTM